MPGRRETEKASAPMSDMSMRGFAGDSTADRAADRPAPVMGAGEAIGAVMEIAGSGSLVRFGSERMAQCMLSGDPAIALAGQVGSQIKIRVGHRWLIANVRTQKQDGH